MNRNVFIFSLDPPSWNKIFWSLNFSTVFVIWFSTKCNLCIIAITMFCDVLKYLISCILIIEDRCRVLSHHLFHFLICHSRFCLISFTTNINIQAYTWTLIIAQVTTIFWYFIAYITKLQLLIRSDHNRLNTKEPHIAFVYSKKKLFKIKYMQHIILSIAITYYYFIKQIFF